MMEMASQSRFASVLRSPLRGIQVPAWQRLVGALEVQRADEVSERGGFGSYDLRPRRLAELGLVTDLCRKGGRGQIQLYTCRWIPPWTRERFLADPLAQLDVLARSMTLYQQDLQTGRIEQPEGLSLAGTLAILHCGGRGALSQVVQRGFSALFSHTRAVYERAQGAF